MSMDKVRLKQEELLDGQVVLSDINPATNTKSIEDSANGLPMTETLNRLWAAINNKLARNVNSVNGRTGVIVLTSEDVGLGNVDNVSYEEIKQWVLETFDELFGEGHFRVYDSMSDAKRDAAAHGKEYNNIPFYTKIGEPITKTIGGVEQLVDDYRAYIGYFVWDPSTAHVAIGDSRPINAVGWSDNSIVYVNDEHETFFGNTHVIPFGGIGVNIHKDEEALILRNPDGIKSQAGLAIDQTKLAPRVYYFERIYKKDTVAASGFLWNATCAPDEKGDPIEITIDGVVVESGAYLRVDPVNPTVYQKGDVVVCNFRSSYVRGDDSTSSTLHVVPEPADASSKLMFRNTGIGYFTSAPSIDHPDDPYKISFSSTIPVVGCGLKLIPTHTDEAKSDVEIGISVTSARVRTYDCGGVPLANSELISFNPTPFSLNADLFNEPRPDQSDNVTYSQGSWSSFITVPWDWDEGGRTGRHITAGSGIHINMDSTLCLMPMRLVRAGNQPTSDSPYGDEYQFDDYDEDHPEERYTRPYGSRVANNWHHPYMFFDDLDMANEGSYTDVSLLSVNLTKIIETNGPLVHGATQSFYNTSGLRVTYMTDVAYNGYSKDFERKLVTISRNILDGFNDDTRRNYFGIIDGFDTDGRSYDDMIPRDRDAVFRIESGISVNNGKYIEIAPSITENAQEYYDGGKVQVRAGHGTEETCFYYPLFVAGSTTLRSGGACSISVTAFEREWAQNIDNSDPDYQFYCVPGYLTEFLLVSTASPKYDEWICDEEPFLRNNIEEIPLLPVFTLADAEWFANAPEYYHLMTSMPNDWEENYTNYFTRNHNGTFSAIPSGDTPPSWDDSKYYRHSDIPDDWVSKILVDRERLAEAPNAYDFAFDDTYKTTSPLELKTTNEPIPGYTTEESKHTYKAVWYTKDNVTGMYVPINFTPSNTVVETVATDIEYRATNQQWDPTNPVYKMTAQRVDPRVLAQTHSIIWKRPTNRLGIKPDRKTLSIQKDGSIGVMSPVVQYKPGEVYHKNQMVESNGKVYICIKDYFSFNYNEMAKQAAEAAVNESNYSDTPTYLDPSTYGEYKPYRAISIAADMEAGYLSNRFSMDAVVEYQPGESYAYGQLVQHDGYLYLVIKSYGDYTAQSIEDDIDNGYLSDAFNTSTRKILYFRDIRGRSFEFDPSGTMKQRAKEEKYANDPSKLSRLREYEYVKLGPGLRITGGSLPPEVECNKTELRASLLEEVERMSVAEEIMYARTLDPTFGTSASFEYQSAEEQNAVTFTPGSMYTMGQYVRSGSYLYLCIKNYDDGSGTPYTASDSAAQDEANGYLAEYSKIYDNAGTIEALTSIEDVMNLDQSFLATIGTIGEDVDTKIIKNDVLSKDSTLTELRTFKATLDTIRWQLEDPKVFFPMNKEYLLDDWRTLQNRVRAMVLTANNKKDASTTLYPALVQEWFGNNSSVQPTFRAIQAATNDFLQVEIRTLEWLFTTWATMVRNSSELAATFVEDQNVNKCDYCACGDADVICNHECAHCTKNPENNENAYWAYVQVDTGTDHDAIVYDSLNTETHRELFRIPYGTRTVCIPLNTVSDWVKVALNGQVGYALKSSFKIAQDFNQIGETVISATVNIFDTFDASGHGITLYDENMVVSEETKIGVFHTYTENIPRSGVAPDERCWEILNSEWTQITLMDDDGQGYTTGYVETPRLIFS